MTPLDGSLRTLIPGSLKRVFGSRVQVLSKKVEEIIAIDGKTTKGNMYLRALLAEIVWGISHTKDNYLSAHYHRLARRGGKTKAIVAVSHTVAMNFYNMITKRIPYQELGANYFDTLDRERLTKHTVKRLEALGYEVTLTPKEVGA